LYSFFQGDKEAESQASHLQERRRHLHRMVFETIAGKRNTRTQTLPRFKPTAALIDHVTQAAFLVTPTVLTILLLGISVGLYEGWSLIDSVYWTAISSYTIGFGDISPKSSMARLFCVAFLPLSVAVVRDVLGRISLLYRERQRARQEEATFLRALQRCNLRLLPSDHDGQVSRAEFISFMLVALQIVTEDDLKEMHNLFDCLVSNNSGTLLIKDLPETSVRLRAFRTKKVEHV
jgi:voltage-gated potassium channel